jgi:hypothetical protein
MWSPRSRRRTESTSGPTAVRGSVGSASVWDPATRARRLGEPQESPPLPTGLGHVELEALVAGIVQVTLDTRLADWDDGRRAALGAELHGRLLAIFGQPAVPTPPAPVTPEESGRPDDGPEESEPALRADEAVVAEIVPAPGATAAPEPPPVSPAARKLGELLLPRLVELGNPVLAREDLRVLLVRLAQGALDELPPGGPAPQEERLGHLDVLQRRAAKLERSLKEARSALAYVSGLEHVDTGLSSIYRVVQGLSPDDPNREAKRGSLERIFQANLELQKRLEGGSRKR